MHNCKISEIKLNPDNPRIIKDEKFLKLVKSIKEFPEMLNIRPIVVNAEMMVLGGNMRLRACKEAGLKEVPILIAELSAEQQKEFIIKDNASFGEWDYDILANDWQPELLDQWGIDLPFDYAPENAEEDDFETPDEVETDIKTGDYIEIGNHRLLCGDSASDIPKLMKSEKADLIFTDPPYGVSIGKKNEFLNSFQKAGMNLETLKNDNISPEELKEQLLPAFKAAKKVMSDDCSVFVTAPQGGNFGIMMTMMMEAGLPVRHIIIWKKNSPTFSMGRLDYDYQHEHILFTWGKKHAFYGKGKFKTSIWEVDKPLKNKEHPTMKPIALIENAILNHSKEGEILLDFYLGSGSSMVAAHQLKRRCFGIEITPKYCQVIINRMLKLDPALVIKKNGETLVKNKAETKL